MIHAYMGHVVDIVVDADATVITVVAAAIVVVVGVLHTVETQESRITFSCNAVGPRLSINGFAEH